MAGEDDHEGGSVPSLQPTQRPDAAPQERRDDRPDVDEDAVIREGIEARRRLGRQVAQETLADPGGLTPERLRRLGPEGLQRFVVELRRSGLGVERPSHPTEARMPPVSGVPKPTIRQPPASPTASAEPSGKIASAPSRGRALASTDRTGPDGPGRSTPRQVHHPAGSIDATSSGGWWCTDLHAGLPFEQWAIIVGLLVGTLATLVSLLWLARTQF